MGGNPFSFKPMFSITVAENNPCGVLSKISILCKVFWQILFLLYVMKSQGEEAVRNHDSTDGLVRPAEPSPLPGSLWWGSHPLPVTAP